MRRVVLLAALVAGCHLPTPSHGLRPESPGAVTGHPRVPSLQPELAWEAFPTAEQLEPDSSFAAMLARLDTISYDLRIRRDEHPMDVVYEREGLLAPHHRVETPLEPDTDYQWSVRPRFRLDGRVRVGVWSTPAGRWRGTITPLPDAWRFRTP